MNPRFANPKQALLTLTSLLVFVTTLAAAQSINPRAIVSLTGAVEPGHEMKLVRITPSGGATPFVVPPGKILVLTDILISPQEFPAVGQYSWTVISSPELTTGVTVVSTADDASSFQVHLTTGMVFHAGSSVRFGLTFGETSVNISACGYLVLVQ